MSFQKTMNRDVPVGVEGDFASTNPYHTVLAGEGALKAGESGVTIGRFAWANLNTGFVSNAQVEGGMIGFVRRDNTALITDYLAQSSLMIPKGSVITLYDKGDFWARFESGATVGQKVYASMADGTVIAADTVPAGAVDTQFVVASQTTAGGLAKITR